MNARLYAILWGGIAALTLALLIRNMLAIPALAPLDPNEGWNAAHTLSLLAKRALYPPPQSLMINNYPPLSFYPVGALSWLTGDAIIAGRILALLSFLGTCGGIALVLRQMGCSVRRRLFAVLFFAATLLIASNYVGMDDPQLLGHAVQLAALLLLLRERIFAAALIFAASLFIKHNLLALPLAAAVWLSWRDQRAAWRFLLCGIAAMGLGLVLFWLFYGANLPALLASPRLLSPANVQSGIAHLWWAVVPLAALVILRGPWKGFCLLYAGSALIFGLGFSAGDGVDINVFFDLAIACALVLGLLQQSSRRPSAALCVLPLFLIFNFHDNNFFFTRAFAAQSARDIAFLKSRPGPALCDQLSLCLWAGKGAQVDVFNVGEQIKTGTRDAVPLAEMIAAHRFAVLQLQELDALGPAVRLAIEKNYRLHHNDDNGQFLIPRRGP
jgi:hypothetical protein